MTETEALKELLVNIEAGEWPASGYGDDMWLKFHDAFGKGVWSLYHARGHAAYRGSLDAAKALHEAVLPGYFWDISNVGTCTIQKVTEWPCGPKYEACPTDPARAWLIAILKALIAQTEGET